MTYERGGFGRTGEAGLVSEQTGSVLGGRYRLREPIGRGGMGAVWRATDMVLGREVAVKILIRQIDDHPDAAARFRREARILARLPHPRLGAVHDYLEENGRACIVMELLHGQTLQERLAGAGRLPAADAAEIGAQVAEGLQAAHQAGVVHRDVKPENVILTEQGVKLVDFGIALGTGDDRLTATGMLVGSVTYLAPERGAGGPATPASDIYSLAVVVYQMLAGGPPFTGDDMVGLISAHARDPVPPLPADVPGRLAGLCLRAMSKDPAARSASASEFAAQLRDAIGPVRHTLVMDMPQPARTSAGGSGTAVPAGQAGPRGRKWLPAAAAVTVIAAGAVVAAIMITGAAAPGQARRGAGAAPRRGHSQPTLPPATQAGSGPATTWVVPAGSQAATPPAPPPLLAPAGTTVRLAETLRNGTGRPLQDVTLTLGVPRGWAVSPEEPPTAGLVPAGGDATVTWRVTVPAAAGPGSAALTASATCAGAACAGPAQVAGGAIVPYDSFSQTFDNKGIAPKAASGQANLDGIGNSYQEDALAAAGYLPGGQVTHDGLAFGWPAVHPGTPDNVAAQGQTFLITGTGSRLAFLGTANSGSAGGDGTVYYLDGTRQVFHLVMDDWWNNQGTPGQDEIAVTTPQPNGPPDQDPLSGPPVAVYFAATALAPGKTVIAVTLPPGAAPADGVPCLHLFAVGIG